ncbi:MAG: DUF721 domain-containing protein [Proteobacteria bacterium]|nr:DUF721 domain-containing protein [Pseudomonadota bacterium]
MSFRFARSPVSLRERFRTAPAPAADPQAETRAAQALNGKRGRAGWSGAPRAGKAVAGVLKPLMPHGGMGLSELKRRWSDIAGDSFARATPEKLAAGTLTLRVPGALAPFLQQQAPLLIERLKTAGAKIKAVKIEQRTAPLPPTGNVRRLKQPLTPSEESALSKALDPVADPGLKSALMRLGRAVKQA